MNEPQKTDPKAKHEILKCARALFAKKGFEAVSVREIAKESGHNLSMISYYFGGKEGLYKEILTRHLLMVGGAVGKLFKSHPNREMTAKDIRADLKSMVTIIVTMKYDNPEMMAIMQRERVNGLPFARDLHEKLIGPIAAQLVDVFKEAQKKKIIRSGFDPGAFLGVLFEAIVGFMTSYDCGLRVIKNSFDLPKDKGKFIDFLTDLFSQGIMK